jgi:hypothetical protein
MITTRAVAQLALLAWLGAPAGLPAQARGGGGGPSPDRVTVVPGAEYRAGWLHSTLFGRSYRDLWTTPLEVPVLDLRTHAGGLAVTRGGGDRQTRNLRMRGADGREYVFRSVHKDFPFLAPELRRAYAGRVVLDQLKSEFPAGALVLPPLLEAVGVLHPVPSLFVMPDDPALGEHRATFAGMLGTLEERPEEGVDGAPGFAGARRVVGTDKLLELLEEGTAPVDAREYLDARMVDLLVGDWDRHGGQWRWVLDETGAAPRWRPVPRDRDKVFSRYDGLLLTPARAQYPRATRFGPRWKDLYGLAYGARDLDRRLLAGVAREEWDASVARVQGALTDPVIDAAVARLPAEFHRQVGGELAATLRARRDRLREPAEWLYRFYAGAPEVHATDRADAAEVVHHPDGRLSVQLFAGGSGRAEPWFRRTFAPGETREVRVYLHGGADSARTTGEARGQIAVRLVGGGGDDHFSTEAAPVRVYDHAGRNRVMGPRPAPLDAREYHAPRPAAPLVGEGYRDWGGWAVPRTWVGYRPEVGVFAGGGRTWYRNGFRAAPWSSRTSVRAAFAPSGTRLGVEAEHVRRISNSPVAVGAFARASDLEVARFYGFGNDAGAPGRSSRYTVVQRQLLLQPTVSVALGGGVELSGGPLVRWSDTREEGESLLAELRPLGAGSFGEAGGRLEAGWRLRDSTGARGLRVSAGGTAFPTAWDVESAYGEAHAQARLHRRTALPLAPTLVVRGGGERVWGAYPFHSAASVGGAATLRGFPQRRFAGDAALFGSAELHVRLAEWRWIVPGTVGVLGLTDAGRVYLDGDSPGGWHTSAGGGVWFRPLGSGPVLSVTAARGDRTRLYAGLAADL